MSTWCSYRLKLTLTGPGQKSNWETDRPAAIIGSHAAADVVVPDAAVPSRALLLYATEEGLFFRHLPHRPGQRSGSQRIETAETLTLGQWTIAVERIGEVAVPSPDDADSPPSTSDRPGLPQLMILGTSAKTTTRRMKRPLYIVGRQRGCDLELGDARVSSVHAALLWHRGELWCIDLQSANGTFLNDVPISVGQVRPSDHLKVGNFQITYIPRSSSTVDALPSTPARSSSLSDSSLVTTKAQQEPTPPALPEPANACPTDSRAVLDLAQQFQHDVQRQADRLTEEIAALRSQGQEMSNDLSKHIAQLRQSLGELAERQEAIAQAVERLQNRQAAMPEERTLRREPRLPGHKTQQPLEIPLRVQTVEAIPETTSKPIIPAPSLGRARPAVSDAEDPLAHFVSDRLVTVERDRRRRQLVIWSCFAVGIAAVLGSWAAWAWWSQ